MNPYLHPTDTTADVVRKVIDLIVVDLNSGMGPDSFDGADEAVADWIDLRRDLYVAQVVKAGQPKPNVDPQSGRLMYDAQETENGRWGWLCYGCERHSEISFDTEQAAFEGAGRHAKVFCPSWRGGAR